jgi:7-cyano-7-deazaguanine synthase
MVHGGVSREELRCAGLVARAAGVSRQRMVRLPDMKESGELGVRMWPGMPRTYVPMRNAIFYSIAASVAEETGACMIVGGHNKDDGQVFGDARPRFFELLGDALREGYPGFTREGVEFSLPLARMTKPEVVRLAASKGVPLELTWSCHRDGPRHCWECEGCRKRSEAFREAGIPDPLAKVT